MPVIVSMKHTKQFPNDNNFLENAFLLFLFNPGTETFSQKI